MRKLLKGIVEFRQKVRPEYRETFSRLALGQSPDALFIACSDSRVVANLFASTDPGDMFVVRNVGNLVPPCGADGHSVADESEAAALEFSLINLNVSDIIVCGHSECGGMAALTKGRQNIKSPNLREWLRHGDESLRKLKEKGAFGTQVELHNQLSQLNALEQLENLKTYPIVAERIKTGRLRLHAWWFDIKQAEVSEFEPQDDRYRVIDEEYAKILSARADRWP